MFRGLRVKSVSLKSSGVVGEGREGLGLDGQGLDWHGDVPGRVAQHYALQIKRSGKARSGVERLGEASEFVNNG